MATSIPRPNQAAAFFIEERQPDEVFTPEDFTEEHRLIAQTAEEFAINEIVPNTEKIEHKDFSVTPRLLQESRRTGTEQRRNPRSIRRHGDGQGHRRSHRRPHRQICRLRHHLGRPHRHRHAAHRLLRHRRAEEKIPAAGWPREKWSAPTRLSEASSGSDALNCRARAELSPDGKHYILNGEKMWITNGGFADLFTVFAKVDGEKFTAFLVERTFPGFSIGAEEHKMGIRGSSTCPLILNDCKVPGRKRARRNRQGPHHRVQHSEHRPFQAGRRCAWAARRVSLENAIAYAKERKAFDKVIADFGLVREKLANMAICIYVGEAMVYRTVGMMDVALLEVDKSSRRRRQAILARPSRSTPSSAPSSRSGARR